MSAITGTRTDRNVSQVPHPLVINYSLGAWAYWFKGEGERANSLITAALEAADREEHGFSCAYARCIAASLAQCRDDPEGAVRVAREALVLSKLHEFPYWEAWATMVEGWALARVDGAAAGLARLREGFLLYEAIGAAQMRGYALCLISDVHLLAGHAGDALDAADAALAEMRRSGIVFYQPQAHRARGEALAALGRQRASKAASVRALRTARRHRSPPSVMKMCDSLLERANARHERAAHEPGPHGLPMEGLQRQPGADTQETPERASRAGASARSIEANG